MNLEEARYSLRSLKWKYLSRRVFEVLLWSIAACCIAYAVTGVILQAPYLYVIAGVFGTVVFFYLYLKFQLHTFRIEKIISFLNRKYASLEESADLLFNEPKTTSSIELLQQQRTLEKFSEIHSKISFPNRLAQAALLLCLSVFFAVMLSTFHIYSGNALIKQVNKQHNLLSSKRANVPAAISKISITVSPPKYTSQAPFNINNPNLNIPEGSAVSWQIQFTDSIEEASLIFPAHQAITLIGENNFKTPARKFVGSTFYQIRWRNKEGKIKTSDYYKIEIITDRSPEINIVELNQTTEFRLNDKLVINVNANVNDDYLLTDAYIIATVSKGSGESIKFREEKLLFTSPSKISGKVINASRQIDLNQLGLEPGDELYFYAEAVDNKKPAANKARTETYFITLQDTASQNLSIEAGLGVDLMPEYFRSQRQIIIDTEKLLKAKKQISKHNFNSKSNELGYDQKVLRLKYGEFLGEEFETQIGGTEETHLESGEEDPMKKFGHIHDKENEHNLVPEKKAATEHDHGIESDTERGKNLIDAYKHNHDDAEEATFFSQSIRTKLKAALGEMWNAELYLRLHEPQKSLPYQYKALKLLKEVSNDSRIYVHKTGFDPPPLKEERRLTGDLSEIKNTNQRVDHNDEDTYPGIRAGLTLVEEKLFRQTSTLSATDKMILQKAGSELAGIALEKPGQYLKTLSYLKALDENEVKRENISKTLEEIRNSFWGILPHRNITAHQTEHSIHALDQAFIKNLEKLKND